MTTRFLKGFGAAGLIGVLAALSAPAHAADVSGYVPFEFTVGTRVLPPGTYRASGVAGGALLIKGFSVGAVAGTTPVSGNGNAAKFVFHRYGDLYVLREVWMGGEIGYSLPKTRREGEAIRTAQAGKASARVEVPIP